ncbi:hypothetical protein EI42_02359 [Thermosporothrix hazakensis]|uniref:HAMP domain-containing protein n=1 Tax=Thermosporothrix hazakensis TaxID=644383 RepID=A0A326UC42_THEHA|nr:hypothetical protein [Thermosporothrix hazakensis]PZW31262.1 hypothetical protein EI42_02359 [Thermosporothrix hazakensis]GCE50824.1 hypothetical protein KTH_56930 [Thermosporothrix hazakensis]
MLQNEAIRDTPSPGTLIDETYARSRPLERVGLWIVIGFSVVFALLLIVLTLSGQKPGESTALKSVSDIFQTGGQWIGCAFSVVIAVRLTRVAQMIRRQAMQVSSKQEQRQMFLNYKREMRTAVAWWLLAAGIACYGLGGIIWTSFDLRMPTSEVPYPGPYNICYVLAYPFFIAGTALFARKNSGNVERMRLLLDAGVIIGTAFALSWPLLLAPTLGSLPGITDPLAAFLAVYFPVGDILLLAVGVLLYFSPFSTKQQEPVLLRLMLGLGCLGFADSLLGYYNLLGGFKTGTVLDLLWPLSMLLVGLAAIEQPKRAGQEKERAGSKSLSQTSTIFQAMFPFVLATAASAALLLIVAPRGQGDLLFSAVSVIIITVLVVIRQTLVLLENQKLTSQIRGELVVTRRAAKAAEMEADEASQILSSMQQLEQGIQVLQDVHASVARGNFSTRAPAMEGPLLPLVASLNLMLDRLQKYSQRAEAYDQVQREVHQLSQAIMLLGNEQGTGQLQSLPVRDLQQLKQAILAKQRTLLQQKQLQDAQQQRIQATLQRVQDQLLILKGTVPPQSGAADALDTVLRTLQSLASLWKPARANQQHSTQQPSPGGSPRTLA